MLAYFILLIVLIAFYVFVGKQKQSSTLWTSFLLFMLYMLITVFKQHLIIATLLAGVFSVMVVYAIMLIEEKFTPKNGLFRFIVDFDLYMATWIYQGTMKLLGIVTLFVKPTIKIQNGLYNKRFVFLKKMIKKANWQTVSDILNKSEPKQRAFLITALSDEKIKPAHYQKWIKQSPDNALAFTFFGNAMTKAAWDVRGSTTADMIPTARIQAFWERLMWAEQAFLQAIELDDNDPEPFNGLITVGMGLQQNKEVLSKYFVQMLKRDSNHYFGHQAMLSALTAKWGGGEDDMLNFVRRTVTNLPEGHPLYGLIPAAHIEQWLYYSMINEEQAYYEYFRVEDNIKEINAAFEAYSKGIEKPDETDFCVLNLFTFCFYQQRDVDKTQYLLKLIGDKGSHYPWYYCDGPFLSHLDTSYAYSQVCEQLGVS